MESWCKVRFIDSHWLPDWPETLWVTNVVIGEKIWPLQVMCRVRLSQDWAGFFSPSPSHLHLWWIKINWSKDGEGLDRFGKDKI